MREMQMMFGGMEVVVLRPTFKTVIRSWRERLFSRPWRPWLRTREVVHEPILERDKVMQIGSRLFMHVDTYEKFLRATKEPQ